MDIGSALKNIPQWVKRYRYPLVVVLVGLVLLTLPTGKKTEAPAETTPLQQEQELDMAQQLKDILGKISGVGRVEVMLTVSVSETSVYNKDEQITTGDGSSSVRKETVIITDSNRNQQALITQTLPPVYRGAIIVCQGGDNAAVKLAVVEAVSKATGLGASQISVLKMK